MITDIENILKGYFDLHVHAGPSIMDREVDGLEMVGIAKDKGLKAIVLKDHYFPTAGLAKVLQDHISENRLQVYGGLALNRSVGGLNPKAVEAAIGFGAKFIWMPTISSKNHIDKHSGHGLKFPGLKKEPDVPEIPIVAVDSNGELIPEAKEVIDVISRYPNVVLATGHGAREEVNAYIKYAASLGVKKIYVNHPHYMVDASLGDLKIWRKFGAYLEFNAVVSVPKSQFYCKPIGEVFNLLTKLGPDHIVLSSDYGQLGNGSPVDGFMTFIEMLVDEGMDIDAIKQMTHDNPNQLLN